MNDLSRHLEDAGRVVVFAPHPDDETLAAGGLLHRWTSAEKSVRVVFLTDGDNNPWAQRAHEWRWHIGPAERARWGRLRRGEAVAALAELGVGREGIGFMALPDQGVTRLVENSPEVTIARFVEVLRADQPDLLIVPSFSDLHPDHSATAMLLRAALWSVEPRRRPPNVIEYQIHPQWTNSLPAHAWVHVPRPCDRDAKQRALECHRSQLRLRRRFMMRFVHRQEFFLDAGAAFGAGEELNGKGARTRGVWDLVMRLRGRRRGKFRFALVGPGRVAAVQLDDLRVPRALAFGATNDPASVCRLLFRPVGRDARVTVLAPDEHWRECFVQRQPAAASPLQLFDRWPWVRLGGPATVPSVATRKVSGVVEPWTGSLARLPGGFAAMDASKSQSGLQ